MIEAYFNYQILYFFGVQNQSLEIQTFESPANVHIADVPFLVEEDVQVSA